MKLELHQSDLSLPPPSIPYADNSGEGSSDKINHCHSSPSWSSDHCFHNEVCQIILFLFSVVVATSQLIKGVPKNFPILFLPFSWFIMQSF